MEWHLSPMGLARLMCTPTRMPLAYGAVGQCKTFNGYSLSVLWAATVVTFSSFRCSEETIVGDDAKYDPNTHLSFSNVAVDDPAFWSIFSFFIKQSKTDQERVGVRVIIGRQGMTSALSRLSWIIYNHVGVALEHYSCGRMGHHYPSLILSRLRVKHSLWLIFLPRTSPDIIIGLGWTQQQPWLALKIQLFRHWAGGRMQLTVCMSGWILITWPRCHRLCLTIYRGSPRGCNFHILFLLYMIVHIFL